MLLSIIIPVYNVAPYVEKCLASLLCQGLAPSDYELIVVNDGSTDESYTIAKTFLEHQAHLSPFTFSLSLSLLTSHFSRRVPTPASARPFHFSVSTDNPGGCWALQKMRHRAWRHRAGDQSAIGFMVGAGCGYKKRANGRMG